MKKIVLFVLLALATFISTISMAKENRLRTVTIINHFNDKLTFIVDRYPEIVPDLAETFVLSPNQHVTTRVLIGTPDADVAYIRTEATNPEKSAFWSVGSDGIHGYMDLGIAYSWNDNELATLTFCTPEEYSEKGEC